MSVGAKHECQGGGEHECADEPWSQAGMPAAEQQWAPGGKKISARDAPQLQTPSQTDPGDTPCTPANIPPPRERCQNPQGTTSVKTRHDRNRISRALDNKSHGAESARKRKHGIRGSGCVNAHRQPCFDPGQGTAHNPVRDPSEPGAQPPASPAKAVRYAWPRIAIARAHLGCHCRLLARAQAPEAQLLRKVQATSQAGQTQDQGQGLQLEGTEQL